MTQRQNSSNAEPPFRIGASLSLFPPIVGGAELLLLELAKRWVAAGHPTTVFTRRVKDAPKRETLEGVNVERVIRTINAGPLFGASFVASLAAGTIRHRNKFDVLLAFQAPWESAAGAMAASIIRKPMVVTLQQSGPFGDLANTRRTKGAGALLRLLRKGKEFVGLSRHAASELEEIGCPRERVHVITNGIDVQKFRPPPTESMDRKKTVLFVGRFVPQKNPEFLLRAWQRVNSAGEYKLQIVGAGPLEDSLRNYCSEQQLQGVEFLGRRTDMVSVYQQAGVFALPSVGEGCCMALLESMACGVCPVVTRVGGNLDVIEENRNGLFVESNDVDGLAKALTSVLQGDGLRTQLATAAVAHIRSHHDIDRAASDYLNVFRSALQQNNR